ncbi:MAG TPA: ATPase, T2SS/T4P/T4SS family, partial [Thermoanaerobaculia bacterium]
MAVKLGELLLKAKLISADQLNEALKQQKETGIRLGEALVRAGWVTEEDITEILSAQFGVPSINLAHFEIDPNVLKLVPADVARKYNILPVNKTGATLTIAMADPTNVFAMDDIKFMTGYNVEPVVAAELALQHSIDRHYGASHALELKKVMEEMSSLDMQDTNLEVLDDQETEEAIDLEKLVQEGEEAPVVRLVNIVLTDAIKRGASDIHVEPYEREYRIRYRIDGILYEVMNPPPKLKEAIASRIKIKMKLAGKVKELDYRVSVLPTLFGEKIVCRLLDKDNLMLDMTKLGFEKESLVRFEKAILRPWGMVLVTGPTGSGKTNTLYSALSRINTPETNIITAEDPVEFNLPGINQVQMKDSIGLNFAAALRSFLRQDPNIILVGEIRDFETAEIAVKAALTGHLVLSTLHTNDAPSTINRLMNMGIEPYLVATS